MTIKEMEGNKKIIETKNLGKGPIEESIIDFFNIDEEDPLVM